MRRCVVCLHPRITTSQGLAKPIKSTCMITRRKCFNVTTRSHTSRTLDPCRNADHAQLKQNCGKGTLLEKVASLIPSYYDTRFESKRQTITTSVSKPSAHLARILSYFHWALNVNGWTYAHVCLQIHNGKKNWPGVHMTNTVEFTITPRRTRSSNKDPLHWN